MRMPSVWSSTFSISKWKWCRPSVQEREYTVTTGGRTHFPLPQSFTSVNTALDATKGRKVEKHICFSAFHAWKIENKMLNSDQIRGGGRIPGNGNILADYYHHQKAIKCIKTYKYKSNTLKNQYIILRWPTRACEKYKRQNTFAKYRNKFQTW